jgi:hypothetical protein
MLTFRMLQECAAPEASGFSATKTSRTFDKYSAPVVDHLPTAEAAAAVSAAAARPAEAISSMAKE